MTEHFQEIFRLQDVDKDQVKIKHFLTRDEDPAPYGEFLKRQIPEHLKQ